MTVLRPGDSPHSYQPSDREISDVMRARVYFRIGRAVRERQVVRDRDPFGSATHRGHAQGYRLARNGIAWLMVDRQARTGTSTVRTARTKVCDPHVWRRRRC